MNFSQEFVENVVLLALTAGLTSVLIPLLLQKIDERKHRDQKRFEAELARQSKIIDAQVKFVEDLAQLLWEYQLLLIAVPYYRQFKERELYAPALKAYEERAGELLGKIRAEVSKALRLSPHSTYLKLKTFYYEQLLPLDLRLSVLVQKETQDIDVNKEWSELIHFAVNELSEIVDQLVDDISKELSLK